MVGLWLSHFGSSFKSQIVYDAYPIGDSHRALLSCAHIKISQFSPACFGENLQIFKLHIWTSWGLWPIVCINASFHHACLWMEWSVTFDRKVALALAENGLVWIVSSLLGVTSSLAYPRLLVFFPLSQDPFTEEWRMIPFTLSGLLQALALEQFLTNRSVEFSPGALGWTCVWTFLVPLSTGSWVDFWTLRSSITAFFAELAFPNFEKSTNSFITAWGLVSCRLLTPSCDCALNLYSQIFREFLLAFFRCFS